MIAQLDVFVVTAVVSLLAYFWLVAVLKWNSPNVIDLPEAIITLAMFPMLLAAAFVTDKGYYRRLLPSGENGPTTAEISDAQRNVSQLYGKAISAGTIKALIELGGVPADLRKGVSRAKYRTGVTRIIAGDR